MSKLRIRPDTFLLVFNTADQKYDAESAQSAVESSVLVKAWWNYFPGVYLIQIDCGPHDFAESLYNELGHVSLFMSKVNEEQFSGRLPGDAWLWILDISDDEKVELKKTMQEQAQKRAAKN